jgi:peptidoglycan/xylan/chitin deacetylase (PgdA/CDA1 family)
MNRTREQDGSLGALAARCAQASGATALVSRLVAGRGCLFTFHRVAAPQAWCDLPNRDFHIDSAFLGRLLDYLVQTGWAVVSMDEVVGRLEDGDQSRFVNFSIDDVYRDTIEAAVPVFRSRNLPLTLFVTTGIPDGTLCLWEAGLEAILSEKDHVVLEDGSTLDAACSEQKRRCFTKLRGTWEADRPEEHYDRFCILNGCSRDSLHHRHAVSWAMLEEVCNDPGVEIGGHTVSHPRLSGLPENRARSEVAGCRARLQERLGLAIRHFAFPYGRRGDCGPREFALAREAGFNSAATTRKGLVGPADRARLHSLPRNTLNGAHQHLAYAEMHLSGLGGLIARGLRAI